MDLLNVFGFLESSRDGVNDRELEISTPIFAGEHYVPIFGDSIERNFETGEMIDRIDDLSLSAGFYHKASKDVSLPDVENRLSELARKLRGNFHMDSLDSPNVSGERSFDNWDPCELLLTEYQNGNSQLLTSLEASNVEYSGPGSWRMKSSTVSRGKYAIEEDTSEQLPEFSKLIKNPAYQWPFELDTFQKQAILCLERNQSVFVAAHTSAGKTVIAEYASAMCRRRGSRVIYTSPIKALSNQKFHDFRRTFGDDVGLLTGDIKVATDSSFLVMTTEILYNMLCNAADAIRDLEIVIMDEVHYLNDAERGHVWEQIMIMLPKHVLLVMLSATVPNTVEFADWLGRIRDSEIHVVATNRRPVPLEHYLFTGLDGQLGGKQLHLIVDQNRSFNLPGYKQAVTVFNAPKSKKPSDKPPTGESRPDESKSKRPEDQKQRGGGKTKYTGGKVNTPGKSKLLPTPNAVSIHEKRIKNMWLGLVRLLQERELMPAIAFGFSRSSLEVLAQHLSSVDLLNHAEKNEVQQFLRYSIKTRLKGPDAKLPSVLFITELVSRGIAVHHAGMLPILKETVEMLFQRGLVRLLFATETFAMGVNMPARCVLFTTLEKFDGRGRRPLNPGEYTQMAGRAGRRGLDASGTVIILVEGIGQSVASIKSGVPSQETLTRMILGTPSRLSSQFKITYSMILHLHRSNWLSPQDIMRRSFMEANALRLETERRQCLTRLRARLASTTTLIPSAGAVNASTSFALRKEVPQVPSLSSFTVGEPVLQVICPGGFSECVDAMGNYYQACSKLRQLNDALAAVLANHPLTDLQRVFCPGRLCFIHMSTRDPSTSGRDFPDWLVPAMIVDVAKNCVHGISEVQWSLVTWQVPSKSPYFSTGHPSSKQVSPTLLDDPEEEGVLRDGEPFGMSHTPYPPQLMPVYMPSSFEDALAQLTIVSGQDTRSLVRVCDQIVEFKLPGNASKSTTSLVDLIHRAVRRHRQEVLASEAGLRLVVGSNNAPSDCDLSQLMVDIAQGLFNLVEPLGSGDINADTCNQSTVYGLPTEFPVPLHLGRALRAKSNTDDESSTLFDELWMLNEELTTPLPGDGVTRRVAPVTCPDLVSHLALIHRTFRRRWAVKRLEESLSRDKLQLNTEYTGRLHVLKELGFIDSATERGCLTLKGLVACELQQMEVLLTQLLLDGSFTQLPPADIAALLSCFVFEMRASDVSRDQDKSSHVTRKAPQPSHLVLIDSQSVPEPVKQEPSARHLTSVPVHLQPAVFKMTEFADKLEELQRMHNLNDPTADTRLNYSLVHVTHAWATGHPFATLVQLTDIPEGQLVRGLLRLDELLRHICNACHRLGDKALGLRMNEAREAIHRDLICAPSLYISDEFTPESSE